MFKRIFLAAVFFICASTPIISAQEVTVKSSVNKNKLSQNDTLEFRIEVSGRLEGSPQIKLPDFKNDFEIISSGQSQSISINEKGKSQSAVFEYILAPKKSGKITIGEVKIKYGFKAYATKPIDIEVKPSAETLPSPQPQEEVIPSTEGGPQTII